MPILLQRRPHLLAVCALTLFAGAALLHLASRYNPVHAADIAALPLRDQDDAPHALRDWRGQLVVLDFIYTGCGDVCPLKTAQLANLQAGLDLALRHRVHFVSVSIDPEHDDPAALRAYAARAGADLSDWSFLTGDLSNVARFAAAFDAMAEPGGDIPDHITTIHLLDQDGHVVGRYAGEPLDDRLATDIVHRKLGFPR
jgi:protein SCO1/2